MPQSAGRSRGACQVIVATFKIQTVFRFAQKSYLEAIEIKMIGTSSRIEPNLLRNLTSVSVCSGASCK